MASVACPHCAAVNEAGSTFCQACGKALPLAAAMGPRVISGAGLASTSAGMKLQGDELHKQLKKAAGALLTVAILQTAFGAITYLVMRASGGRVSPINAVTVTLMGIAAIFWALYFWARVNPLPAAIVGLVIYVTLWAIDVVYALMEINHPGTGTTRGGSQSLFKGIVLKIIIVAILVRAIKAGQQYRKLQRQQHEQFKPLQALPVT